MKFDVGCPGHAIGLSHPTRGAWIEIPAFLSEPAPMSRVAPHTGCVD